MWVGISAAEGKTIGICVCVIVGAELPFRETARTIRAQRVARELISARCTDESDVTNFLPAACSIFGDASRAL